MSKKVLDELKNAVVVGNVKKAKKIAEQTIELEIPVNTTMDTLMKAMKIVDERYQRKEYFVIDVASSASAMREAFKMLEPYLEVEPTMVKGTIIIGSLKGNIQGLGKDIVAATLQSAGLKVVNLGVDVAPQDFVKAAVREKAQIIAISVSMEETTPYLKDIIDILKRERLRDKIKVIIGGTAVSEKTCRDYGLDAYAVDAQDGLQKVKALFS
ncbi:MAG TPA: cobalamin-dependent protein [Candidatus Paceibacterota bacterium]|nr:cobalamin-dependent protein [Candidatus Paceibacterota bacterium]